MSQITTGVVKWFNDTKGFGFIQAQDGQDVFAHFKNIHSEGFKTLTEGQYVQFTMAHGPKGLQAENITSISN